MKLYCTNIWLQMQAEMNKCKDLNACFHKQVECSFEVAFRNWNKIKQTLNNYTFNSETKEIEFYKILKPKFTSEIEYFALLYHCILFQPKEFLPAVNFLEKESKRLEKFEVENGFFIQCFEASHCKFIPFYFLRKYHMSRNPLHANMHYTDIDVVTNGDHLAAMLLALRRYNHFVKGRLIRMQ